MVRYLSWILVLGALACLAPAGYAESSDPDKEIIEIRAFGVPDFAGTSVDSLTRLAIMEEFQKRNPHIRPVSPTGLTLRGGRTQDIVPLMQIAGDIAPHAMLVNFRQSDTSIRNKLLYPLDKYIEKSVGIKIENSHLLNVEQYVARIKTAPGYKKVLADRVPAPCWPVIRRKCPYGEECPYLKKWGAKKCKDHYHIWAFPIGPLVMAMFYRKDMFAEAGLPDRAPKDWDEMLRWARKLHNPPEREYGLLLPLQELSWGTLSFLYSRGGLLVDQDEDGIWRCVFDSPEAVEAYYFVARLFHEPHKNEHGEFDGVVYAGDPEQSDVADVRSGMFFSYLDDRFFGVYDPSLYGFGPVPKGPTGKRGSEFNAVMLGIYAGLDNDKARRDAVWKYIQFYDGHEARKIRTRIYVENGVGNFIRRPLLEAAGYEEYVRLVPKEWEEAYQESLKGGIPEPYGRNCQMVYTHVSKAVNQIRTDPQVKAAIKSFDAERAKRRIHEIVADRVQKTNAKMLNILPPDEMRVRKIVAGTVAVSILIGFALLFRYVFKVFTADVPEGQGKWQFGRYKWAYIMILPAAVTIALWMYYPLARGSVMAFQDYNVRGFSKFIGMENFARVLFDGEFWFAMWVTLKYGALFMLFGFWTPIGLAFLLTEVPKGKILFRTIYYLPAVLTGVIVMFLWRGFYGPYGMVNQVLNLFVGLINYLPGVQLEPLHVVWLDSPKFALFFCLLPLIWAGMGPGCLIYLAALKTIPEDLYEAADIDGAGIWSKIFNVAIPGIKGLIMINFIGVMVAQLQGGGSYILAMTGGGPYTPNGQTEVIGLHIFFEAFGFLRFGIATAMAWVLGSFLIGFTVLQLQKLKRMEFKTAGNAT